MIEQIILGIQTGCEILSVMGVIIFRLCTRRRSMTRIFFSLLLSIFLSNTLLQLKWLL